MNQESPDFRRGECQLTEYLGVAQVHDFHIWAMSTTETALTAHLVMPAGYPGDEVIRRLCESLHDRFGIVHPTIQIEVGDHPCSCPLTPD